MPPVITLRYFACQGRGEYLRLMLKDLRVDYTEEKIGGNITEWMEKKRMMDFAGPYGHLPVLEWLDDADADEVLICETMAIGQFLDMKLRWPDGLSPERMAKASALGSFVYEDLLVPLLMFIVKGVKGSPEVFFTKTMPNCLNRLEAQAPEDGFLLGDEPCWGEFLLFQALCAILQIFGKQVLSPYGYLMGFFSLMLARPALKAYVGTAEQEELPITIHAYEEEHRREILLELREAGLLP